MEKAARKNSPGVNLVLFVQAAEALSAVSPPRLGVAASRNIETAEK